MFSTFLKIKYVKVSAVLLLSVFTVACSNPSTIRKPSGDMLSMQRLKVGAILNAPKKEFVAQAGDSLRIIRNAKAEQLQRANHTTLYVIDSSGSFYYPYAGLIEGAGKTLPEIQLLISTRLAKTYREPEVSVNLVDAAGNKYFVGGAVARASAYEIGSPTTLEQAILQAGGVLTTADSENVALLRLDAENHYQVYFFDYSRLLGDGGLVSKAVLLQRGDIVYVPKSGIGNALENVDMYLNKLVPFTKGVGFNYELNRP